MPKIPVNNQYLRQNMPVAGTGSLHDVRRSSLSAPGLLLQQMLQMDYIDPGYSIYIEDRK